MNEAEELIAQFKEQLRYQIPTVVVLNHDTRETNQFSNLYDLLAYVDKHSDRLSFAFDIQAG